MRVIPRRCVAGWHLWARTPTICSASRAIGDLAVNGDDLLAAGVRPGPEVGETLSRLLSEVLDDPSRNTRDELLRRVAEWRRE
jgi:hypothetical protein